MDPMVLKYFQFVAMYRNFSRAAEHFYIGQSALSRQIANLEKELGVQLFIRDTRNVSLTPAGQLLYDQSDALLRHHEVVIHKLDAARSGHVGWLAVASVADFGATFLAVVKQFIENYPEVSTQIDDIPFDHLADSVINGVYDIAITLGFGVPKNDLIVTKMLGTDRLVAVMSQDYPDSCSGPISLPELCDMRLILPRHVPPPVVRKLPIVRRGGYVEHVPNTQTALLRAQLGLGVVLVPHRIVSSSRSGVLKYRELADADAAVDIVAVYRADNQQQTVANFLAMVG